MPRAPSMMADLKELLTPLGIDFAIEPLPNGCERIVFGCGCAFGFEGDRGDEAHVYQCRPDCAIGAPLVEVVCEKWPAAPVTWRAS